MKQGGTVLFDTRDAIEAPPGPGGESQTPGMLALRGILASLDMPELEPVPREHVLTKTFYLLRDFPGRFTDGQTWVETCRATRKTSRPPGPRRRRRVVDDHHVERSRRRLGDAAGRPADVAADAGEPRQREFAFRAGVNIVMYTLTGNYKADQVHIPALLERLGQ